jgi:hypothetical protein
MECEEPVTRRPTGQIVMDYLTDTVVNHKVTLLGQPYITPDSRTVVTVHRERTSITLYVQRTSGNIDTRVLFLLNNSRLVPRVCHSLTAMTQPISCDRPGRVVIDAHKYTRTHAEPGSCIDPNDAHSFFTVLLSSFRLLM